MEREQQKPNPYEAPKQKSVERLRSYWVLVVLSVACVGLSLLNIAVVLHAFWKILSTTPFMGIKVDAAGNPFPIEGYPQLGFGLVGLAISVVLSIAFAISATQARRRI